MLLCCRRITNKGNPRSSITKPYVDRWNLAFHGNTHWHRLLLPYIHESALTQYLLLETIFSHHEQDMTTIIFRFIEVERFSVYYAFPGEQGLWFCLHIAVNIVMHTINAEQKQTDENRFAIIHELSTIIFCFWLPYTCIYASKTFQYYEKNHYAGVISPFTKSSLYDSLLFLRRRNFILNGVKDNTTENKKYLLGKWGFSMYLHVQWMNGFWIY